MQTEWPYLGAIRDPAQLITNLDQVRREYNTVRLHAGIAYDTTDDEHHGRADAIRAASRRSMALLRQRRLDYFRERKEKKQ